MADLISKVTVPVTVVGLQQHLYEVDGEAGDLIRAVTCAEVGAVDALEELATDSSAVVRERQKRVDELGRALASISKAKAYLDGKQGADDAYSDAGTAYAYSLQVSRGYDFGMSGTSVRKGDVEQVQKKVEHESELMNSRLNQASTSLKDYISKRDKVYSQLEKAIKKIHNSSATAIREMS